MFISHDTTRWTLLATARRVVDIDVLGFQELRGNDRVPCFFIPNRVERHVNFPKNDEKYLIK